MTDVLQVKNWSEFQQYKDRDPKWIKLHRDVLDDYDFDGLTEIQQCHLMKIWLLAAKLNNKIPADPKWIARKIGAQSKVDIDQLVTSGFLVPYRTVQDCTETYLETEAEAYKQETEEETESPSSGKPDQPVPSRVIFDYWREVHNHPKARLDDKRRKLINARLSDGYTVEDLMTAIDGCKASLFHQGDNRDGKVYDGLDLICRDGAHVDQFIKIAHEDSNPAGMGKAGRATARAAAEWLGDGTNG